MKRLSLAVAVVLSITTFAIAQPPDIKPSPSTPVTVVNTPVPVTVPGGISVTGTVQSQQSGPWNVGINGDVNITNTPTVKSQQSGPWNVGINGNVNVTNIPTVKLTSDSVVTTNPAIPALPFAVYNREGNGRLFGPVDSSTRLAITSVIVSAYTFDNDNYYELTVDACNGTNKVIYLRPSVRALETVALSFPSPLVVGSSSSWCLNIETPFGPLFPTTIVGYVLVP